MHISRENTPKMARNVFCDDGQLHTIHEDGPWKKLACWNLKGRTWAHSLSSQMLQLVLFAQQSTPGLRVEIEWRCGEG